MEKVKTPYIVYAESTPNPNAMRYVADQFLVKNDKSYEFSSLQEAKGSPLAERLFNFPFVTKVFISGNYLSISKDDSISWDYVTMELREFILEYLNNDGVVIDEKVARSTKEEKHNTESEVQQTQHVPAKNPDDFTEMDKKIVQVLEEYIEPAVAGDGGAIEFLEYKDGTVSVILRGACSGCPSSTMTLKAGIEALLNKMVPEVKEVVAINE